MSTTLAEFRTMVLETYKRTDKATELDRAINNTYFEMVAATHPRKSQDQIYRPAVVGREEYPFPDSILRINHPIRIIDPDVPSNNSSSHHTLVFKNKDEYDEIEPNPNATSPQTGRPWAYTIWKNSILLTDIPDKAYVLEINVGGSPTKFVSATDQTIFNEFWDETHKAGTLSRLFSIVQMTEEADFWQRVYRYGYAGNEGSITGGLALLKETAMDLQSAPLIVKNNLL